MTSAEMSRAVDWLRLDRPVGSTKVVFFMPSWRARLFMALTNFSRPPGKVRPSACAARFSLDIMARCSASARVNSVPTRRRERLCRSLSTSSSVMVMVSSIDSLASATSRPVISLVSEATGSTASSFFCTSTRPVSWSMATAALETSRSGSFVRCRPARRPNDCRVSEPGAGGASVSGTTSTPGGAGGRVSWSESTEAAGAGLVLTATVDGSGARRDWSRACQ